MLPTDPIQAQAQLAYYRTGNHPYVDSTAFQAALKVIASGGSGGGFNLQEKYFKDLMSKYQSEYDKAFQEAKVANEARYAEILGGHDKLYGDTMTGLEGMGDAAKKDVNSSYNKAYSQSMQGLVNSGMANSTIVPSVSLNNSRQRTDALNSLNEMLRREKLGYMTNLTGNKLNFMERREDTYPDAGMYASLMNQAAQGFATAAPRKV